MTQPARAAAVEMVEWAVASRPIPGEIESGDAHVLAVFPGGVLAGVIDGLGHGPEAAEAARRAAAVLSEAPTEPIAALLRRCHETLRATRGAVMSIAEIDASADQMTWSGVGDVEAVVFRADTSVGARRESIIQRGGVLGYQLPALRVVTLPIARGDVLILASDGVDPRFAADSPLGRSARNHAEHLLEAYAKATDDALVLVVRYLGWAR